MKIRIRLGAQTPDEKIRKHPRTRVLRDIKELLTEAERLTDYPDRDLIRKSLDKK